MSTKRDLEGDEVQLLFNEALRAAGDQQFAHALKLFERVVLLDPAHAEAYYKRGNALKNLGRLREAIDSYDQAIERKPDFAYCYCNRGVTEQALGLRDRALASYDLAIVHDPNDAMSHYNRAVLLQEFSRWDEALAGYSSAIAIDPLFADAQYNRSLALLYGGNFGEGAPAYEWRWKNAARLGMGEARVFSQPLWLGEQSLEGKRLLLHSEGGFGDTLQFARYATLAAKRGAEVYLEIQEPLCELLSRLDGVSAVIGKGGKLPEFDLHCPLMSLPLAFKTTLDSIPPPAGPLKVDVSNQLRWSSLVEKPGAPRVGLVWSGSPGKSNDWHRSVQLAELLAGLPAGYRFFRLQRDVRELDEVALKSSKISSVQEDVKDFQHIAALCQCMDLVISVDTSVAHLSATLGRPTWLMAPLVPDWRWFRDRNDSPWYPSMRIFRKQSPDSWENVLKGISTALSSKFPIG